MGHSTPGRHGLPGTGGKAAGTAACPAAAGPTGQQRDGDTRQRPGWLRTQGKGQRAAARRGSHHARIHTHVAKKAVSTGPPRSPHSPGASVYHAGRQVARHAGEPALRRTQAAAGSPRTGPARLHCMSAGGAADTMQPPVSTAPGAHAPPAGTT